eukprot:CAMPEP_0171300164 /NCGR_PEP_ID=MMETSP0816-20121228/8966_1 /TAXON_ID=420281 /ORGANISM="Proboscia inermis, Strain CCAP1064/1" /LENGTH=168 /DNA_ID=CAMNT_0011776455 /DNA_START=19 /DNA_END=525 /DNA_ORIENTATION=-
MTASSLKVYKSCIFALFATSSSPSVTAFRPSLQRIPFSSTAIALPSTSGVAAHAHTPFSFQQRCFTRATHPLMGINYLLSYDYIPDVLEKRGPYREGHLDLAKKLLDEGKCLSGGPKGTVGNSVPSGALFIFTDEESAKKFVEQDPYVSNGIVTGHTIEEWNVVIQKE